MARIVFATVSLLTAVFAWLAVPTYERLVENRSASAATRVALVASEIAKDVERAVDAGIEPAQLRGLGDIFAAQVKGRSELVGVELLAADGKSLLTYPQTLPRLDVQSKTQVVSAGGQVRATVRVLYRSDAEYMAFTRVVTVCIGVLLLGALPGLVLFYRALRRGPALRDAAFTKQLAALSAGDYSQVLALPNAVDHDRRMLWLARHIRSIHEKHARFQRLCLSLLATEPSPSRREALYRLRESATAGNKFAGQLMVSTVDDMTARRGWSLLLAVAGFVVLGLPNGVAGWHGAVFFATLALGALSALAIFHASIRDFGCWLFAICLGVVAAFAREAGWLPITLAGLSLGLLTAVVLDEDTAPFWIAGAAVGVAVLQLVPQGLEGWIALGGLLLLAVAFFSRAPEEADVMPFARRGLALAITVGVTIGLLFPHTPATAIQSSPDSLLGFAGLALTAWLRPAKRHWLLVCVPLFVWAVFHFSIGPAGYAVPMFFAGAAAGLFVRQAVQAPSHGVFVACGAGIGCLVWVHVPAAVPPIAAASLPVVAALLQRLGRP